MTKICIFDLDGTLLNTVENIGGHMNCALAEFGLEPFTMEEYCYFIGNGSRNLTERVLAARGKMTQEFFDVFYPRFFEIYSAEPDKGVSVYDGAMALLSSLKARGIRVAVLTNKPDAAAQKSIARFFGTDFFDDVLGAKDGMPLKPSPDGVLYLLEKYGLTKDEAAYIGDTDVDMLTAVASGVRGFGALWGFRTAEELTRTGAYALLSHPLDLLSKLEG